VDIDLAVVEFRAATKYPTAKLGNSNSLTEGMELYVGGFPSATKTITDSIFVFREGKVSANSNKTFEKGYSLVYSNDTLPGMSGGTVLNQNGELVAIHGRGDREMTDSGDTGAKTGFNLGIPIARFGTISSKLGVTLDTKIAAIPANSAPKPDDYFTLGVQKLEKKDYRGALAEFNRAIQLNPNLAIAYNYRGILKGEKIGDSQGALADYNRAIQLNPNDAKAYNNRGILKANKLGDIQGALAEYNRAIQLNPSEAIAYSNRGLLKAEKLGDIQGALADYDRAIQFNPSDTIAYYNRCSLKGRELGNIQGALADCNRAIQLNPSYANAYYNRGVLKYKNLNDRSGGIRDMQQAAILFKSQNNMPGYNDAMKFLRQSGAAGNG
jgi:Flp pilus assembly protein TadD